MNGRNDEVQWDIGPTTVHGTLVRPEGPGPFPAVIMVAGSGPTDRDWNSPLLPGPNGSARLIAEALAQAGFASLRYDKRASGPHARENLQHMLGSFSMQAHQDEVQGGVALLSNHPNIDRDHIFGLGNSEGTLHLLHYQLDNPPIPLAGLILTGLPGRSVGAVARSQLAAQAAMVPNGDALLTLYDEAIARYVAGQPANPDPALPADVKTFIQALEVPMNLPFARELWVADGASLLSHVNVPSLVIIGKKDIQVDWEEDGEPLAEASQGLHDVTLAFPENANHILKYEPQERQELSAPSVMPRYNAEDTHLDAETMETLIHWLSAHTS
jgi:hypothetical protein